MVKADVPIRTNEICHDNRLENFASFDQVFQNCAVNALRLQSAITHADDSIKLKTALVKFAYCVVETNFPYAFLFHVASLELC